MKKSLLVVSMLLPLLLGSCRNDKYDGADIPGARLTVTGEVDEIKTRVTDTDWETDDRIGITGANRNNVEYVAGSNNLFSCAKENNDIYVLGGDTQEFTAYYPYSGEEGTLSDAIDFSIVDKEGNYVSDPSTIDFLYGTATATREAPNANFSFQHRMSKIQMNFKPAPDLANTRINEEVTYKLKGVMTKGKFHPADGSITATATGDVTVTTTLGSSSSIILPPATAATEEIPASASIVLEITVAGTTYIGTINPSLNHSNQYNYSVELSVENEKVNISVSSNSIGGWTTNEGENVEVEKEEGGGENEGGGEDEGEETAELSVGDFVLADGTILPKTTTDFTGKEVVAVVFYVGNPRPSELYDATDYPVDKDLLKQAGDYTRGLAISLKEEAAGTFADETDEEYCLHLWYNSTNPTGYYPSGYTVPKEGSSNYGSNAAGRTNFLGYNNTKLWQSLATAKNLSINALTVLESFKSANSVSNTSGWYLPSTGELIEMSTFDATTTSGYQYGIVDAVKKSLATVGGTELDGNYWSSTDGRLNSSIAQAMAVNYKLTTEYKETNKALTPSAADMNKKYKFRFILAF